MIKYELKDRTSYKAIFTAEIDCEESASESIKKGLAVNRAIKSGADLSDADLSGADLRGAILKNTILNKGTSK